MKSILVFVCALSLCGSALAALSNNDRTAVKKAVDALDKPNASTVAGYLKDIGSRCSQADLDAYKLDPTCTQRYTIATECITKKGASSCAPQIHAVRQAGRAMLGITPPPPRPRATGTTPPPPVK